MFDVLLVSMLMNDCVWVFGVDVIRVRVVVVLKMVCFMVFVFFKLVVKLVG